MLYMCMVIVIGGGKRSKSFSATIAGGNSEEDRRASLSFPRKRKDGRKIAELPSAVAHLSFGSFLSVIRMLINKTPINQYVRLCITDVIHVI